MRELSGLESATVSGGELSWKLDFIDGGQGCARDSYSAGYDADLGSSWSIYGTASGSSTYSMSDFASDAGCVGTVIAWGAAVYVAPLTLGWSIVAIGGGALQTIASCAPSFDRLIN